MLPLRSLYYSSFFPILFFLVTLSPTLMSSNFFILFPAANLLFPLNPSLSVMLSFFPKQTAVCLLPLCFRLSLFCTLEALNVNIRYSDILRPLQESLQRFSCSHYLPHSLTGLPYPQCKKIPFFPCSPSSLSVSLRLQSGHSSVHI